MLLYHAINGSPIWQSANIPVVYPQVNLQLTRKMVVLFPFLLWIVTIYGIELHTSLPTPVYSLLQEFILTYRPKYETMMLAYQLTQRLSSERQFLTYLWIGMFYYRPIEIYSNSHSAYLFIESSFGLP